MRSLRAGFHHHGRPGLPVSETSCRAGRLCNNKIHEEQQGSADRHENIEVRAAEAVATKATENGEEQLLYGTLYKCSKLFPE
ncbi:hypothetical protein SUGI_0600020 [Cryptomeria japonica]|nr:hypothetical protein SUGI_0600020 [Cryptomeria japonica]